MQIHKLGEDFTKSIKVNLLPHIQIERGYLRVRIDWTSPRGYNSTEYNADRDDLNVQIGQDVHAISFWIQRHNSFPSNVQIHWHTTMRVDRLILLNLACKLIRK